ncbi:MAG: hypothetical protein DCC55_28355 [Chloroflexi bacterium]|nr:MAG: hypothetical protein DCC55_28355 [Chloroflexota bacterium]
MQPAIAIPEPIQTALDQGATLAISVSAGKDSQAMLYALTQERDRQGWPGEVFAIHACLGRMEWPQTLAHCEKICAEVNIPLIVVERPQGDLLQEMQDRMKKLEGQHKPHWPSSTARYCTADQKRAQIDKVLRTHQVIISAEGLRSNESAARAKRPEWEYRQHICTRQRTALTWRPILHWSVDDVWQTIGTSTAELQARQQRYQQGETQKALDGWPAHPAYVMGNQRLSCAICVLASRSDIINGARHNPELYRALVEMEEQSGFSFRQDLRLADLELDQETQSSNPCQLPLF